MVSLFTKPIETLAGEDVVSVLGWPESSSVEYKQELPGRDGRDDAWLSGRPVENYALVKIFKEIVALANTSGGHLVLGIEEAVTAPATANAIRPVPRCVDLAERLSRSAQSIDPPIPMLLVQGVPTEGDAGIVLFRVPASRAAPHRSTDKECYVRRGTNSVAVSMREIQDMTLAAASRADHVERFFSRAHAEFIEWLGSPFGNEEVVAGFRVTAVPVRDQFDLGRLYGRPAVIKLPSYYGVKEGERSYQALLLRRPERTRPIVRGVKLTYDPTNPTFLDLHSDGVVNFGFRVGTMMGEIALHIGWIVGYAIAVSRAADLLRAAAESPDCEYAMEVAIATRPEVSLHITDWRESGYSFETGMGDGLHSLPLLLPRISFGPMREISRVISFLVNDLSDATGAGSTADRVLEVTRF